MLTLTNIDVLRRNLSRVAFEVSIGAPVNKTITRLVSALPVLRQSIRPTERTPDNGNISIEVSNADNVFNWRHSSSILYGVSWHRAPVTVQLGVRLDDGSKDVVTVTKGYLEDVKLDRASRTAELTVLDQITRLKRDSILYQHFGTTYRHQTAAGITKDILTKAGFVAGTDFNAASFDTEGLLERGTGRTIREFVLPSSGVWWSALSGLLSNENAGLRVGGDGLIYYHKFRPVSSAPVVALSTARNISRLEIASSVAGVVNKYKVNREDYDGSAVETSGSPLSNSGSIASYGETNQELSYPYLYDGPAEASARELLSNTELPFDIFEMTAPIDLFPLEVEDLVSVTDAHLGLSAVKAYVMSRSINVNARTVELVCSASSVSETAWLFAGAGHTLDSSRIIW